MFCIIKVMHAKMERPCSLFSEYTVTIADKTQSEDVLQSVTLLAHFQQHKFKWGLFFFLATLHQLWFDLERLHEWMQTMWKAAAGQEPFSRAKVALTSTASLQNPLTNIFIIFFFSFFSPSDEFVIFIFFFPHPLPAFFFGPFLIRTPSVVSGENGREMKIGRPN